jgi:hypothetical protein
MTDLMKVSPPKFPDGPVQGADLQRAMTYMYRDVLSRMDVRYANNDFSAGLVANGATGGVTLGTQAIPAGRTVGVPTLVNKITNTGTASDQTFLPQVSAGNKLSVQNILALSATAGASTATITIAAHTNQYGFGQTSYSSGSITGLSTNTLYYVYADDPNYSGGAVSYIATTNPQTVTAANGRYYVGSITTPLSATTANISGATSANPIVFQTSASHGWNTGDSVTFAALPGSFGVSLNGHTQAITVTDGTHFSVAVDGSAFPAYTTGGSATRVSTPSSGGGGGGGGGGGIGGRLP